MKEEQAKTTAQGLGVISLILGIWLIVSPFMLSYDTGSAMNDTVVLGIIVSILSIIRLAAPSQRWAGWLNILAGLWLIIAPFIFSFDGAVTYWNDIIVGVVLAVVAFWAVSTSITPAHPSQHIVS